MLYVHDLDLLSVLPACRILPSKGRRRRGENARDYINIISGFDIETTRLENDNAIMYIWQWSFFDLDTEAHIVTIYGRTWDEYRETCNKIAAYVGTVKKDNPCYMVRLVHNLSYEYQFLSGIYDYTDKDVFALDRRKVARADSYGCIEDRCTFIHSNQSLDKYAKTWGAVHQKLSGITFDYTKTRYPWTPMSNEELAYCEHDVLSVCESYINEMKHYNDTVYSVPLTATGYVRRDAKTAWGQLPYSARREWVVPDLETYTELRDAFRGGNTHANRYAVNPDDLPPMIHYNVLSCDKSSCYPEQMCNRPMPLGKWTKRAGLFKESEIWKYRKYNRACLFRARFENIRLKNRFWGCPYISKDKCYNLRKMTARQIEKKRDTGEFICWLDNGRILEASRIDICLTDIDLEIIKSEYEWDELLIFDLKVCRYQKLPKPFVDLIHLYYTRKTELKGVEGKERDYAESKAKINSLYGMCAQKTVHDTIVYMDSENPSLEEPLFDTADADAEAQIQGAIRNGFLPYSVGVWVTAWARYSLEKAIKLIHDTPGALFLYADTDSVKYTGNVDFSALNAEILAASKESGSFATDRKGHTHYMGVFEQDGQYKRFATMGAKKYIYEDEKGVHVTVAGLVKYSEGVEISALELQEKGGFSAFRGGTTFIKAGGLEALYNDSKDNGTITIDGHTLKITRNVCLCPSTYTLGETDEYSKILKLLVAGGCRIISVLV